MSGIAWALLLLLLAAFLGAGGLATMQQHRHSFAVVLAGLGYRMRQGRLQLVKGSHLVEAPTGPHFDLVAPVLLPRAIARRQDRHGKHGKVGDAAFDRRFFVGVAEPWAFHGLSADVRELLLRLAQVGEVTGGPDGVRVRLPKAERHLVTRATDLLVALGQAAARRRLEHIVRSDPSDRVAAEALRALHLEDPARADQLALAVERRSAPWRRERARIRRDVPAIAAFLDAHPRAIRLLDQLDDQGVASVLDTCTQPIGVLLALKRAGIWDAVVPKPVGRAAWRAIRTAIQHRSLRPDERRELVPVWLWARDHVGRRDAATLGALALQVPSGAVPSVLETLAARGQPAVPMLQTLERTLTDPAHRALARDAIERLTAGSPHRGALALAEARGGTLAVAPDAARRTEA